MHCCYILFLHDKYNSVSSNPCLLAKMNSIYRSAEFNDYLLEVYVFNEGFFVVVVFFFEDFYKLSLKFFFSNRMLSGFGF